MTTLSWYTPVFTWTSNFFDLSTRCECSPLILLLLRLVSRASSLGARILPIWVNGYHPAKVRDCPVDRCPVFLLPLDTTTGGNWQARSKAAATSSLLVRVVLLGHPPTRRPGL